MRYLIDGRNRLDAMELVGLDVDLEKMATSGTFSATAQCTVLPARPLRLRRQRQHPPPASHRRAAARSDRQAAQGHPGEVEPADRHQVKDDHKKVGAVRDQLEATGALPQLEKTTGKDGKARRKPQRPAGGGRRRVERHVAGNRRARAPVGVKLHAYPALMRTLTFGFTISVLPPLRPLRLRARPPWRPWTMRADLGHSTEGGRCRRRKPDHRRLGRGQRRAAQEFVKLRGVEIGQADPFAVPTFLRRAP